VIQTKVFFACNDPQGLENKMNTWLEQHQGIEILEWKLTSSGRMDQKVTVLCIYKMK